MIVLFQYFFVQIIMFCQVSVAVIIVQFQYFLSGGNEKFGAFVVFHQNGVVEGGIFQNSIGIAGRVLPPWQSKVFLQIFLWYLQIWIILKKKC